LQEIAMSGDLKNIAVLGAGSWGSTLAWLFASSGKHVRLYAHRQERADQINSERAILRPFKRPLPPEVTVSSDLERCIENVDVIVFCCTSQSIRELGGKVNELLQDSKANPILVSAVKGLELGSLKRMSQVLEDVVFDAVVCTLSGPNLAFEILSGLPTASVIASRSAEAANSVQQLLSVPKFRLYTSRDIIGVELGGTLKNIIAIAAGASDGLNLGANAKAALLTRGLAEMTRLSVRLQAEASTLAGLAGMGDLFATCSGPTSRNYKLGMELSKGRKLAEILFDMGAAVEGVPTTEAVCELSIKLGLELPIAEQVESTLKGKSSPEGAIMTLMGRPLSSESRS